MDQNKHSFLKLEQKQIDWTLRLAESHFSWLGHILLRELRFAWRHRPRPAETGPQAAAAVPTGPYASNRKAQMGDLLLWVPRGIDSLIIDDLTGGFGYSHISVDTGEVDLPTGKPIMAEVTVGETVARKFQDEYGGRAYGRIPLSQTGVDPQAFLACIKSRFGEPYDDLEALTLGEIDDPAKQVCSSLASGCLPESLRRDIAQAGRRGLLSRGSVSIHTETRVFISPNGFAQYYRAPRGNKLPGPDFLIKPRPLNTSLMGALGQRVSKTVMILGIAAAAAVGAGLLIFIIHKQQTKK